MFVFGLTIDGPHVDFTKLSTLSPHPVIAYFGVFRYHELRNEHEIFSGLTIYGLDVGFA